MNPSSPMDPEFLADLHDAGGDALVREVIATFADSVPPRVTALRDAAANGDPAVVASAAHAIVSAASMLGLVEVEMLARVLEDRARGGELPPRGAPARLERAVQDGVALLRAEAARLSAAGGPASPEASG